MKELNSKYLNNQRLNFQISHFTYPKLIKMLFAIIETINLEREIAVESKDILKQKFEEHKTKVQKEIDDWRNKYNTLHTNYNNKLH